MKPVVGVTEKEYHKAQHIFEGCADFSCQAMPLEEDVLAAQLREREAFAAILGVDGYVNELYGALPRGGVVARFGVGHDGVDKGQATAAGVIATNTPGVLDDSVAEHTVFLMGALARNIAQHDRDMKAGQWAPCNGFQLRGKTLLVVGCGPIGCKTARIAAKGLGMRVLGCDVATLDAAALEREYGIAGLCGSLEKGLGQADFVSLHLPAIAATHHFVNAEFLAQMRKTAFLVNTARGSVLDEGALYDALQAGAIAGAALDVFEQEPFACVDGAKDIRTLENLLLTPHVASTTEDACVAMAERALANVRWAFEKRYEAMDVLNPDVLATL